MLLAERLSLRKRVALALVVAVVGSVGWRYFHAHLRAIDLCWGEAHGDYHGCVSWARASLYYGLASEDEIMFELDIEEEPMVREI